MHIMKIVQNPGGQVRLGQSGPFSSIFGCILRNCASCSADKTVLASENSDKKNVNYEGEKTKVWSLIEK